MLYQGRVRWEGSIDEIKATDDPVVREFVEGRPTEHDGGVPGGVVART